jgi:pimeloyl-ACP methyl ester carboxylesterase
MHGHELDPDLFLDFIRLRDGGVPFVCVGGRPTIPLLRAPGLNHVSVFQLKIDGTHIWPPYNLSAAAQVEVFARALQRRCTERQVVLIGFSYGGILAYRLAVVLLERGWSEVGVVLIEPDMSVQFFPFWRSRLLSRLLKRKASYAVNAVPAFRTLANRMRPRLPRHNPQEPSMESEDLDDPDRLPRFRLMAGLYQTNTDSIQPCPLQGRMALVGSEDYHARFAGCWRRVSSRGLDQCILTNANDHFASFRQPHADQWVHFVEQWFNEHSSNRAQIRCPGGLSEP